ncbi:MAG: 50S ribosomal protein L18 [Sedimentisphaeraceae bacterium JB056]
MNIKRLGKSKIRRKFRVRKKAFGTPDRPRLSVCRSNRNISAQIIDDMNGVTLVAANTLQQGLSDSGNNSNIAAAAKIGDAIAKEAVKVGITQVNFDRGSYRYHGRVKALAEAARKAGLVF